MGDRILMTTDTVGGVWNYALSLIASLAPYEIEVGLATMGRALTDTQWEGVQRLDNVRLYESEFRLEWMNDPWDDLHRAERWLKAVEVDFQPDIVHLNHYAHTHVFSRPSLVVAHSDVLSWWRAVKKEDAPARWKRYRKLVTDGLNAADRLIAPTHAMCRAIERHYRPKHPIEMIPNGIALDSYSHSLPRKEDFVLAVGRLWDEAKNIAALDRIAPELRTEIFVAGEAQHPDGGQSTQRSVKPLGFLSPQALRRWYRRASIYALPAFYEPFGLSVLEAASHGCALVLGAIPSLQENWKDAAIFVPPHDDHALLHALQQLALQPALCRRHGILAQRRAQHFTLERQAQSYMQIYRQLKGVPVAN